MNRQELRDLVTTLAVRSNTRTEADIQSDVRALLLSEALDLNDSDLEILQPSLESQLSDGTRRRIDIEAGFCVIEVKKRLTPAVAAEAIAEQLPGYVARREQQTGCRYTGMLTDGRTWQLFRLDGDNLSLVREIKLDAAEPDVDGLLVWLESVFATKQDIPATPNGVSDRLGAASPSFALDLTTLSALYDAVKGEPEIRLKRELWAKSLTTAFGTQFDDSDTLFVNHTYLVSVAELIAHVAVGFDLDSFDPFDLVSGTEFTKAGFRGVVEADFFDWVASSPDEVNLAKGRQFIRELGRRVSRFDWLAVDHDVLKSLYESVIAPETRHKLGEYYTPDWLANKVVDQAVDEPLEQRVLDPSCGSGTFLFAAIRRIKAAAADSGWTPEATLTHIVNHVIGIDLHPVAVTLARVTYLLALGDEIRQARPASGTTISVFLGDSLQWDRPDQATLRGVDGLTIATADGLEFFARELRFPESTLQDIQRFDALVAELSHRATDRKRESKPPQLTDRWLSRFEIDDDSTRKAVRDTFGVMCELHDRHRDHIWSYYVRNLARPLWLARPENQVDVMVGNPPWVAYRHMTERLQSAFKNRSDTIGLRPEAKFVTNSDLAAFFVVTATDAFLRPEGRFSFVMPRGVLRGPHYKAFRTGAFPKDSGRSLAFTSTWDLAAVRPFLFPVPSCVVFGEKGKHPKAMPTTTTTWLGRLNDDHPDQGLTTEIVAFKVAEDPQSPYHAAATQGTNLFPRYMFLVEEKTDNNPLGAPGALIALESRRSGDKGVWATLPSIEDNVEPQFVRHVMLGFNTAPHKILSRSNAVLPVLNGHILDPQEPEVDSYPGLASWWRKANTAWDKHSAQTMSLTDQINWMNKLTDQFPIAPLRVAYAASGTYMSAVIIDDPAVIIESSMYALPVSSRNEATYLTAALNSQALLDNFSDLQPQGNFGTRHFHRYPLYPNLPTYDPTDSAHKRLSELGAQAEQIAAKIDTDGISTTKARRLIRDGLTETGTAEEIDMTLTKVLNNAEDTI